MFLHLSVILLTGGRPAWLLGGHAWLLQGGCMVAPGGGHAWLLLGGMHGCSGGVHGCSLEGACVVAPGGVCMVAPGGCAWLLPGGMRGCSGGVTCMVAPGGACVVAPGGGGVHGIRRDTEIRSMSGRYASYWNAFLCVVHQVFGRKCSIVFHAFTSKLSIQTLLSVAPHNFSKTSTPQA